MVEEGLTCFSQHRSRLHSAAFTNKNSHKNLLGLRFP